MENKTVIKGVWWLPGHDDDRKTGLLRFESSNVSTLELFGSFDNTPFLSSKIDYSIINGISSKGIRYTLVDNFIKRQSAGSSGFPETDFHVNGIYENLIVSSKTELVFSSLSVSFIHLDDWLLINGFSITEDFEKKTAQISYQLPEKISYAIDQDFSLNINFSAQSPSRSIAQKEALIKQNAEIEVVPITGKNTDWYLDIIHKFKHLLMLSINNYTYPVYIQAKLEKEKERLQYTDINKPINIYFRYNQDDNGIKELSLTDFLYTFPQVKNVFNTMLISWFSSYESLSSPFNLFFETIYKKGLTLENKFLNLSQSLESYHRKKNCGEYMNKDEYHKTIYKELSTYIPTELDEDFKESLKSRIKFGYEYSLRRRLKELFRMNDSFLTNYVNNYELLQKQIVETRNYYTHYDEKTKFVMENSDLYDICEKIKVIIITLFLFENGWESGNVKTLIENQELTHRFIKLSANN